MYFLPILLALLLCGFVGFTICYLDAIEQASKNKGRLDKEQEARMDIQEWKRVKAINYVAYRFKR